MLINYFIIFNDNVLQMIINHGVRGSIPNPSYQTLGYGGNTPCVEFKTKKYQLIFDCGSGFSKVKIL